MNKKNQKNLKQRIKKQMKESGGICGNLRESGRNCEIGKNLRDSESI